MFSSQPPKKNVGSRTVMFADLEMENKNKIKQMWLWLQYFKTLAKNKTKLMKGPWALASLPSQGSWKTPMLHIYDVTQIHWLHSYHIKWLFKKYYYKYKYKSTFRTKSQLILNEGNEVMMKSCSLLHNFFNIKLLILRASHIFLTKQQHH